MPFQAPSERKFCILSVTPMCPKCALCSSSGMLTCKLIHPRQLLQGPDLDFVYRSHGHTHFPGNLVPGQPLKIGNTNYHGLPFFQQGGVVFQPLLRLLQFHQLDCNFFSGIGIQLFYPVLVVEGNVEGLIRNMTIRMSTTAVPGPLR